MSTQSDTNGYSFLTQLAGVSVLLMLSALGCGGTDGGDLVGAGPGGPGLNEPGSNGPGSGEPGGPGMGGAESEPGSGEGCAWPEGQAAVSLTYDDAMPTQLSTAVPALKAHGLTASFFITDVRGNMAPWKALLDDGHELAAHTFNHPCPAAAWVPEGDASEDYDLARMETELDEQVVMLRELGQPEPFTFAYPCGVDWVGAAKESYVPLLEERFLASRGVMGSLAGRTPEWTNVPSFFLSGTADAMIAQVDAAKAAGSWVVFGFHGIGGDWEITPAESHEALLQYLDDQSDEIYIAPFRDVVQCLK